jgi:hypothetical protein
MVRLTCLYIYLNKVRSEIEILLSYSATIMDNYLVN